MSRLLNLFFWPKVCDTNNCFALLQIPTKFQTVLTALGPGLHDEDTAINLTLLVILHTENWPVGIYFSDPDPFYICWSWSFLAAQGLDPPPVRGWVELRLGHPLHQRGSGHARHCAVQVKWGIVPPFHCKYPGFLTIPSPAPLLLESLGSRYVAGTLLTKLNGYFCAL